MLSKRLHKILTHILKLDNESEEAMANKENH
jgi:hypothetical protein